MARMYSRKRGKSGSTMPSRKVKPTWMERSDKEIETLVAKFKKEGKTNSQIGMLMRDLYGVPDVKTMTGKRIGKIVEEKKLQTEIPEDILALMKKYINLKKHMADNKHDVPGLRGIQLTESKIRRLVKYYKRTRKLPLDWKFDEKTIKLQV